MNPFKKEAKGKGTKIFTIRDSKAESYFEPFYAKTNGLAERQFQAFKDNKETIISKHPEDFDLYELGEFDPETGKILTLDTPHHIIKAINLP